MQKSQLREERKRSIALIDQIGKPLPRSKAIEKEKAFRVFPKQKANKDIIKEYRNAPKPIEKTQLFSLSPDPNAFKGATPVLGLDCEMVLGVDDVKHIARVSVVNYNRHVVLDAFVRPPVAVKDYLTELTNITHHQLRGAAALADLLPAVQSLLAGRTVVGHSLENDFELLKASVERRNVRDVSLFAAYRKGKFRQSLKALAQGFLGYNVQSGAHSSVEDARAALELYKLNATVFERELREGALREAREQVLAARTEETPQTGPPARPASKRTTPLPPTAE